MVSTSSSPETGERVSTRRRSSASVSAKGVDAVPPGKVSISVLPVSGQRSENLLFSESAPAEELRSRLHSDWPKGWELGTEVPRPPNAEQLRFLYFGRFVDLNKTFSENHISGSAIVHLTISPVSLAEKSIKNSPSKKNTESGERGQSALLTIDGTSGQVNEEIVAERTCWRSCSIL